MHLSLSICRSGRLNLLNYNVLISNYQNLKLLEIQFNEIFRPFFLPVVLSTLSMVCVFCTVIFIRLWRDFLANPGLFILPVGYCNSIPVCSYVGIVSAKVNNLSKQFLRNVRIQATVKICKTKRTKANFKRLHAIADLKIRFGDIFINSETPLMMLNFCLLQIANLLILSG